MSDREMGRRREGEKESGRVGEWESGRVGEWETLRRGDKMICDFGNFNPLAIEHEALEPLNTKHLNL